jgi:hypothetical protein
VTREEERIARLVQQLSAEQQARLRLEREVRALKMVLKCRQKPPQKAAGTTPAPAPGESSPAPLQRR